MKKLQEELKKFVSQYDFLKTSYKYDVILLAIYPIYMLLYKIGVSFVYDLEKFSTLFAIMFFVGLILAVANNKIKEAVLANGVLCIIYLTEIFGGGSDNLVYAVIYGLIAFGCYKLMSNEGTANVSYDSINNGNGKTSAGAINSANMEVSENTVTTEETEQIKGDNIATDTSPHTNNENRNTSLQLNINSIDIMSLWQPIAAAVVVIFSVLQDWFKVDLEFVSGTYSISNIKDVIDKLVKLAAEFGADISEFSGTIMFVNLLHYGLYIIIIAEAVFCVMKIIDNEKYKTFGMIGSMFTIIITVILFILKVVLSAKISEEVGMDSEGLIAMTWFPLLATAAAVWQLGVMGHRGKASASGLEVVGKKCKVCGTMNHEDAEKCGKCGSALSGFDVVYKK